MDDVEKMVKTTLGEIEKVLDAKTVVGEPIILEGTTLIPLLSVGFGFAAGSGSGKVEPKQPSEAGGGGTGGGGGLRPIAIIVIDKEGVRIEPIKGGMATAIEKLSETIPDIAAKITEKWGEHSKEGGK